MAKFNEQVNLINSNPQISSGVQDRALEGLLGNAVNTGMAVYSKHTTEDMWEGMQGQIEDYLQNQADLESGTPVSEEAATAKAEFGALAGQEDKYWEMAGNIPQHLTGKMIDAEMIDRVQIEQSKKFEQFVNAQKQGRISLDELQTRIMTEVRKAVSNNPLIQDELIQQAQKYMEISGASSWMKQQFALEKQALEARDAQQKQLEKYAIDFAVPIGSPGWEQKAMELAQASEQHKQTMASLEYTMKQRGIDREKLAILVNDPKNQQVFNQGALAAIKQVYSHASVVPGAKASDVFFSVNSEIDRNVSILNSIKGNLPADQRASIDGTISLLEKQREIYKDLITNEPNKQLAQNKLSILEATYRIPNVAIQEQLDIANKYFGLLRTIQGETGFLTFTPGVAEAVDKDLAVKMMAGINQAQSKYSNGPAEAIQKIHTPEGKVAVQAMSNLESPQINPNAIKTNSDGVQQMLLHLQAPNAQGQKDVNAVTQATDEMLKQLLLSSQKAGMPIAQLIDQKTQSALDAHIGSLLGQMRMDAGQVDYDENTNRFSYVDKDGRVNQAASDRANALFKTYISVNGFKDDDAIDKWANLITDKIQEQRWEARTTEDVHNLVKAGKITEAEAYAILTDPAFGKQEQPKKTTTPEELAIQSGEIPSLTQEQKDFFYNKKPIDSKKGVETLQAYKLRSSLGLPPPKDVIPFDQTEQYKIIEKAKADAIEPVGFLEHLIGMGVGAKVAKDVAGWAFKTMMEVPEIPAAGRIAFGRMASNVTPLNEGASKAVVQAYKAGKKVQLDAAFKEYFKTGWTKSRVKWPSSDAEWPKFIDDAWEWAAKQVK